MSTSLLLNYRTRLLFVQNVQSLMRDISPKDLARSLGVSESSVKRWVDDGALAASRTAGGHRRIALAEALRFVRSSGTPVENPELFLGATRFPSAGTQPGDANDILFSLLQQDDAPGARAWLLSLYVSGWSVAAICDGPIRFAMEKIGTLWRHGVDGVLIEHRATDTCVRALAELRGFFVMPEDGALVAVGAAPSGDPYLLPSMMAAAVLADLGFRDFNLGPNCPVEALSLAVEKYRARIAWLAVRITPDGETTRAIGDLAARIRSDGGTMVVGGQGAPPFHTVPGIVPVHTMAELAAFGRGIQVGAPSAHVLA